MWNDNAFTSLPFDPQLAMLSMFIAGFVMFTLMAATHIIASRLSNDEKLLRITALIFCPPIGILVHLDCPPPRDTIMAMRMKGWIPA